VDREEDGGALLVPISLHEAPQPRFASREDVGGGRRPLLVKAATVTADTARTLRMPSVRGVVLLDVMKGGAAESSGLRAGDVILSLNGSPIGGIDDLRHVLNRTADGRHVVASVWRLDRESSIVVHF
jgi:S1-C subfamily serine protease